MEAHFESIEKRCGYKVKHGRPSRELSRRIDENGRVVVSEKMAELLAKEENYSLDELGFWANEISKVYEKQTEMLRKAKIEIIPLLPHENVPKSMAWMSVELGTYTLEDALQESPRLHLLGGTAIYQVTEVLSNRLNLLKLIGYSMAEIAQKYLKEKEQKYNKTFLEVRGELGKRAEIDRTDNTNSSNV